MPIVAVMMVGIIAMAGFAIDVGNLERVRAQMQSAADAAATAGASSLIENQADTPAAKNAAIKFGMDASGRNKIDGVDTKKVIQTVDVACDTQYSPCAVTTPNTVTVHESASVPTYFLSIFGFGDVAESVDAEACGPCAGPPTGHDIVLVLDHTGSMAADGGGNQRKIDLLKSALLQGFMTGLNPSQDRVAMVVFPPNTADSGPCSPKDNGLDYYADSTRTYLDRDFTTGYADATGAPNPSSPLIQDIGCLAPAGRTDYADPMAVAKSLLDKRGRAGVPKAVVMISDGAANQIDDPLCRTTRAYNFDCLSPCGAGIDVAKTLKDEGIKIYAVAYGSFGGDERCDKTAHYDSPVDPPYMTGYQAMQAIASAPDTYLADPDPTQLKSILGQVSSAITGQTGSRLVK